MVKLAIAIFVVLAGGIAVAYLVPSRPVPPAPVDTAGAAAGAAVDFSSLPLEERLVALERTLGEERQARQLLQEELVYLTEEVEALREQAGEPLAAGVTAGNADLLEVAAASTRRSRFENRNSPEYRIERLVDAGISADRAEWILQREAQIRLSLMEARYDAQRNGESSNYGELQQAEMAAFRNELGTADYERYLEGTGRPTSVVVGSVLDTSPAQNVGIQPGDEIVRYGGTRVYNMSDLNRAMLEGEAGETVMTTVLRDGVTMQVAIRRGPLGITAGRGRRR